MNKGKKGKGVKKEVTFRNHTIFGGMACFFLWRKKGGEGVAK